MTTIKKGGVLGRDAVVELYVDGAFVGQFDNAKVVMTSANNYNRYSDTVSSNVSFDIKGEFKSGGRGRGLFVQKPGESAMKKVFLGRKIKIRKAVNSEKTEESNCGDSAGQSNSGKTNNRD